MPSVVSRIEAYNQNRLAEVLPIKYNSLKESLFRFYRGTAHLFYEDLAATNQFSNGPKTWICGDLHLENYGTYKGDNRLIYFDINDFDECVLAPVSLDVLRIITSLFVAAKDLNVDSSRAETLANNFLNRYLKVLINGKPHSFQRETASGLICELIESVGERKMKDVIAKRTQSHNGMMQLTMVAGKTLPAPPKKAAEIRQAFIPWNEQRNNEYKLIDIASRLMGTGSLGLERYILLCFNTLHDKPQLLDLKETKESCATLHFNFKQPHWTNEAERVIKVQSLMQDTPPALLHTFKVGEKNYVIKELQPSQDKLDLGVVSHKEHKFGDIIEAMADITASAHLRAAGRYTAESGDALIEGARQLKPAEILAYAASYSKKVENDFQEYVGRK